VAALFAATLEALRVRGGGPAPSVLPVARAVLAQEREEVRVCRQGGHDGSV
jgi:hypothetical protein